MKRPLALALLLAAALLLRLSLGALHNFTSDEALSYYNGRLPASQVLLAAQSDRHPPTFYLLMTAVTRFTHTELGLRLPCILMAIGTLYVTFQLALLLTRRETMALTSCALLAVLFSSWHFDITARMYEPARLATVTASWFLARLLLGEERRRCYLGYVLASLCGVWMFYFAGAMCLAHAFLIMRFARHDRRLWVCLGAIAMCSLPLVPFLVQQSHIVGRETPALIYLLINVPLAYAYFLGLMAAAQAAWHVDTAAPLLLCVGGLVTVLVLWTQVAAWRQWRDEDGLRARLLAGMLVPYLLLLLATSGPLGLFNLRERYFLLIYPYATILLVYSLGRRGWNAARLALLAALFVVNLGVAANYHVDDYLWDYDMRPLAMHARAAATPEDNVLLYLGPGETLLFNYYFDPLDDPLTLAAGGIYLQEPHVHPRLYYYRDVDTLRRQLDEFAQQERLWLCFAHRQDAKFHDQQAIWALLSQRFSPATAGLSTTTTMGLYGDETTTLLEWRRRTRIEGASTGMHPH